MTVPPAGQWGWTELNNLLGNYYWDIEPLAPHTCSLVTFLCGSSTTVATYLLSLTVFYTLGFSDLPQWPIKFFFLTTEQINPPTCSLRWEFPFIKLHMLSHFLFVMWLDTSRCGVNKRVKVWLISPSYPVASVVFVLCASSWYRGEVPWVKVPGWDTALSKWSAFRRPDMVSLVERKERECFEHSYVYLGVFWASLGICVCTQ